MKPDPSYPRSRRLGALIALTLGLAMVAQPAAASPTAGRLEFDLFRNGALEGRHVVEVTQSAGVVSVVSRVNIRVRAGPVTLFTYEQSCRETWAQSALTALTCATRKQGRRTEVIAQRTADRIVVTGNRGQTDFPLAALPTSWWTKPPAFNGSMIDTETGRALPVRVTYLGRETIRVGDQSVQADHVRVQGTLIADLWYDARGRWIGCAFTAHGQRFEYRLTSPLEDAPEGAA